MIPARIAITGGTGFLGSRLAEQLAAAGAEVVVLTRRPDAARAQFPAASFPALEVAGYDPLVPASMVPALGGAGAVVHLAGAPIAARWTPEVRRAIRESRDAGTRALVEALGMLPSSRRPGVLISASACRYYGVSDSARFSEDSPACPPGDFLADTCKLWEAAALGATGLGLRVVILRLGFVLAVTDQGRAVLGRVRRFLGGRIGSGRQWVSWIHREDAVAVIRAALDRPEMAGAFNAVAPWPVRMAQVTDAFAQELGGMLRVPLPEVLLREVMGDGATVILDGQRVHPDRLQAQGFVWRFPRIGPAVHDILR